MKMRLLRFFILLSFSSCSFFFDNSPEAPADNNSNVYKIEGKKISLVFSHNIHGETHPCGCRTHPLGGLPQIAGQIEEIKKDAYPFYVDTGDTFFDSIVIPDSIRQSKSYNAKELATQLKKLGLSLWVPGDQDFALGIDFLKELIKEAKLPTLVSNLKNPKLFDHKPYAVVKSGPTELFFLGMVHPNIFQDRNLKREFMYPKQWLSKALEGLKEKGYEKDNPLHRLILLSHAGVDLDQKIASEFPVFDWIIGAHTMSFLRNPIEVNKTKIAQVLSRNHYLGEIQLFKEEEKLIIHEVRDEDQKLLEPNPYIAFIGEHKKEMEKLQEKEQEKLSLSSSSKTPLMTTNQCIDCHGSQTEHWSQTPHALAYVTLMRANEEKNLQCVKCHSVGLNEAGGFFKAENIVRIEDEKKKEKYWKEIDQAFGKGAPIRSMSSGELQKMSQRWRGIDQKFEVTHNYANVQCLNCHTLHREHPFQNLKHPESYDKTSQMKKACLSCHTRDQSPEWYIQKANGLAGEVDEEKLQNMIKEISCNRKK